MFCIKNSNNGAHQRRFQAGGIILAGVFVALWTSGCTHTDRNIFARGGTAKLLPMLANVTTGPIAVLLTNGSSYSAEFTLTSKDLSGSPLRLSGPILVRGEKLRLEFSQSNGKPMMMGDIDVIWDAGTHQGYVLSEALQGYAPIYDVLRCTNLATQVMAGPADEMSGHPIDHANAVLQCGDGQTITIQLARARDLGNLPLRLQLVDQPDSFALILSKVRAAQLPDDLFLPPDDFSKFASAEALINELAARQLDVENGNRPANENPNSHDPKFGAMPRTP